MRGDSSFGEYSLDGCGVRSGVVGEVALVTAGEALPEWLALIKPSASFPILFADAIETDRLWSCIQIS